MKLSKLIVIGIAAVAFGPAAHGADLTNAAPVITVASYYFGQYHPNDPRNEKTKGKGWSEWELVKAAKPRFPGHKQPKVPLWGYTDESDPKVMAQKAAEFADEYIKGKRDFQQKIPVKVELVTPENVSKYGDYGRK